MERVLCTEVLALLRVAEHVAFICVEPIPNALDVSYDKDGSVFAWLDGRTCYVTAGPDRKVLMSRGKRSEGGEWGGFVFLSCDEMKTVNLSGCDFSNQHTLASMFQGCRSLNEVDFTGHDFRHITNYGQLFFDCPNLRKVTFPQDMPMENVNALAMFHDCRNLHYENILGLPQDLLDSRAFLGYPYLPKLTDKMKMNISQWSLNTMKTVPAVAFFKWLDLLDDVKLDDADYLLLQEILYFFMKRFIDKEAEKESHISSAFATKFYADEIRGREISRYMPQLRDELATLPLDTMLAALKAGVPIKDILI